MTVAELGRRMDSREFSEWQWLHQNDPFGEARADLRFAWLSYWVVKAFTGDKMIRPEDFLLRFEEPPPGDDPPEALVNMLRPLCST